MRRTMRLRGIVVMAASAALLIGATVPATSFAGGGRLAVNGQADVAVWVERAGAIHASYNDVVISVRAARGCFATIIVIDTDGYIHVAQPVSPLANVWLDRGITYHFNGRDLGLGVLRGSGVAHVCVIGSPYPFDYSLWGEAIFTGRFGYRVYGDPYVALGEICAVLLPGEYGRTFAGVGFARFYVREWRRYPAYLCHGYHDGAIHVRTGDHCRECARVYDMYRVHVNDPEVAVRPLRNYKDSFAAARESSGGTTHVRRTVTGMRNRTADRPAESANDRAARIISARRTVSKSPVTATKTARVTRATGAKAQPESGRTRLMRDSGTDGSRQSGASTVHYKARAKKGKVNR